MFLPWHTITFLMYYTKIVCYTLLWVFPILWLFPTSFTLMIFYYIFYKYISISFSTYFRHTVPTFFHIIYYEYVHICSTYYCDFIFYIFILQRFFVKFHKLYYDFSSWYFQHTTIAFLDILDLFLIFWHPIPICYFMIFLTYYYTYFFRHTILLLYMTLFVTYSIVQNKVKKTYAKQEWQLRK